MVHADDVVHLALEVQIGHGVVFDGVASAGDGDRPGVDI